MQFTKAEEYGVLGTMYVAEKGKGVVTPLSEIAEATKIPDKFLAKIFQALAKSGIVHSHRGVRGGFTLAADPREITIKRIMESIHGPDSLHRSASVGSSMAVDPARDALHELMDLAREQNSHLFASKTVADLLRAESPKEMEQITA